MDLGLKGLKAVVTGASRGIGRAIAECLAAEGCAVGLCARGAGGVDEATAAVEAHGVAAHGEAIDVSDRAAVGAWVGRCAETFGGLHIAIGNASALSTKNTPEGWQKGYDVDLMGNVALVDAALPHLEQSDAAAIMLISSTAALEIYLGLRSYNAIKAALITYAAGLADAHGPKGVRVNSLCPGAVEFPGGAWDSAKVGDTDAYALMKSSAALRRLAEPQEIANAVAFAVSPAASFLTGANLVVDGGLTTRVQY
jgi:3-oxoacyl-[acyl-carrier protein] reductase